MKGVVFFERLDHESTELDEIEAVLCLSSFLERFPDAPLRVVVAQSEELTP